MFMNIILPFTLVHKTCASVSDIIIGTTRFGLQSQTTRLHRSSNATRHQWPHTALETDHDQMDSKVINSANGLAVLWLPEQNKTAMFGKRYLSLQNKKRCVELSPLYPLSKPHSVLTTAKEFHIDLSLP